MPLIVDSYPQDDTNEIDNLELLDAKTHTVVTRQEREIKELREEVERLRRGVISLWLLTNS